MGRRGTCDAEQGYTYMYNLWLIKSNEDESLYHACLHRSTTYTYQDDAESIQCSEMLAACAPPQECTLQCCQCGLVIRTCRCQRYCAHTRIMPARAVLRNLDHRLGKMCKHEDEGEGGSYGHWRVSRGHDMTKLVPKYATPAAPILRSVHHPAIPKARTKTTPGRKTRRGNTCAIAHFAAQDVGRDCGDQNHHSPSLSAAGRGVKSPPAVPRVGCTP